MRATNPVGCITRRGFLECGSAALASAGLVGNGYADSVLIGESILDSAKPNLEPQAGKIALEEHFVLAETIETSYAVRDLLLKLEAESSTLVAGASLKWIAAVSTSASFR
jgi:hypothetical protein